MKNEQDYIRDLAEIRSMMERSSRFLSLSGWAGIMAGIYALLGAYIAYTMFSFSPTEVEDASADAIKVVVLAVSVLVLAIGTAFFLCQRKAAAKGEKAWNASSRRMVESMAVPLVSGGLLLLVLLAKGLTGWLAPFTLIFYGLALYNAGKFTYEEVKLLGIIQVALGLVSSYFIDYALLCWAIGFGAIHIAYGIYMHIKYER